MTKSVPSQSETMSTARGVGMRTVGLHDDATALRNDLSALQQQVNQMSDSLLPPASSQSETQSSAPLDVPSGPSSPYTRRIGFANQIEVEAVYQRDPADFIVKVKAALSDSLVPFRWDDAESVGRMKRFFTDAGISLDLLDLGEVQNDNFPSVARSDLVVRGDMIVRHLRAHYWLHEEFVLYWTLVEMCRQYGITR